MSTDIIEIEDKGTHTGGANEVDPIFTNSEAGKLVLGDKTKIDNSIQNTDYIDGGTFN